MGQAMNLWNMDARTLLMEYKRMVELEIKEEKDEEVFYNSSDVECLLIMRLNGI